MRLFTYRPKIFSTLLHLAYGSIGGVLVIASCLYLYLSPKLPSVESLKDVKLQTPLRIYSQDSQLIAEFGEKRRAPIRFHQIPQDFIHAILAAEDDSFYHHSGVDIKGLMRAASQLLKSGGIQSGGSTITMQVARNIFLTNTQTFTRKFNEILLAIRIEEELSKNEILTLYANKIYLGNRAYGIAAAAQVYYGKPLDQLDLAQLAMIAGLPKAPSAYNPLANPSRALIRRNWILERMEYLDYIDTPTLKTALSTPISARFHNTKTELSAPFIAEMARQEALALFGLKAYTKGINVFTTVNSSLQEAANRAVTKGLTQYDARHGYKGPEQYIPDTEAWLATLKATHSANNLIPAIIITTSPQSLTILFKDESTHTIEWADGLGNLRLFINENRRSPKISTTEEAFKIGDMIRVTAVGNKWLIAQIPEAQAAIVALAPNNGAIRALVGGFSFQQSNYNRITQANRQPGSNFKPFIYATALENGFTASSIFNDAPVVFQDKLLEESWRPENDSGKFYGPTRLRKALYLSRNLISIRLLNNLGIKKALHGLDRFGFSSEELPQDLSLALGSHAIHPLNIATAYAILANTGYKIEPHLINHIEDAEGNTIYTAKPLTVCRYCAEHIEPKTSPNEGSSASLMELDDLAHELGLDPTNPRPPNPAPRILDERIAFIMNSILQDVIKRGTGTRAKSLGRSDIGGKTGTTNGPRDAWFSGFNPNIVATAWLGFDRNQLLGKNEYGGSAALPIWIDFMETALTGMPETFNPQPEGLITARIDPKTGLRVPPGTPNAIFEYYLEENLPPFKQSTQSGNDNTSTLPENIF